MIKVIKEKLGDRLVYCEQEKFNGEYVDSWICEVNYKDKIHYVQIYNNVTWNCSIFNGYIFHERKLEDLLDRLFDELDN